MAICQWCSGEMTAVVSCTVVALHRDGRTIGMVPWGRERGWFARGRCHDCEVMPSRFHHPGCDVQECPLCGGQMLSCGCRFDEDGPIEEDHEDGNHVEIGCPTERRLLDGGMEVMSHEDVLPECDRVLVDGIPCTSALRTIIDVAADVDVAQLERMLRNALDRRLFTIEEAAAQVSQPDIAQRPGARLLGEMLRRWDGSR